MANLKINLLKIKDRMKKKNNLVRLTKVAAYFFIFLGLAFLVFREQVIFSNEGPFDFGGFNNFIHSLIHLGSGPDRPLQGEENNRINILLLGMGGEGHDGPFLTDTMILASLDPRANKFALMSIPRDLLAPISGFGWRKINSASAFGELRNPGEGGDLARRVVSKVLALPIPYYLRIDFDAFKKAVDDVGGIKIYIDQSFTDPLYPDDNSYGYSPVSFESGWQMMDGETALKYVRSRHAPGIEGSDFARSRRQQKVLEALKEKIISLNFLVSPKNINNLLENFQDHVKTNLNLWELLRLVKLAKGIDSSKIINKVLDIGPGGPLKEETIDGAYILEPRAGNFSEIQDIANNIFNLDLVKELKEKSRSEEARIEIRNGTNWEGLASNAAWMLRGLGYEITKIGNAPNRDYERTVIYDLSGGTKPNTLAVLKEKFDANVATSLPAQADLPIKFNSNQSTLSNIVLTGKNSTLIKPEADFLIILGSDSIAKITIN